MVVTSQMRTAALFKLASARLSLRRLKGLANEKFHDAFAAAHHASPARSSKNNSHDESHDE
jgi:hypothetical protein